MTGMRMVMKTEQRQVMTIRQSMEMRQDHLLTLRLMLVQIIRNEEYEPLGVCPRCGHKLSLREILEGFNDDPADFDTTCSFCEERFRALLRCRTPSGYMELDFICPQQVLANLEGKEGFLPGHILRTNTSVYYSALIHFGTLGAAFKDLGKKYPFQEMKPWKNKVASFLGRLPDTEIADIVGVSSQTVGRLRKKIGIPRFSKKSVEEELFE